jgi:hypothetical protein
MRERSVSDGVRKVKENTPFSKYTNARGGRAGRAGSRRPVGRSGPARAALGRMGQNPKKIPFRIKIKFLNIPRL